MKKEVLIFGFMALIGLVLFFVAYDNITGEYLITKELRKGDIILTFRDVGAVPDYTYKPYHTPPKYGSALKKTINVSSYGVYRTGFDVEKYTK